jgi:hypothetical protein
MLCSPLRQERLTFIYCCQQLGQRIPLPISGKLTKQLKKDPRFVVSKSQVVSITK